MSEIFSNSNLPYHLAAYSWFAQAQRNIGLVPQPMTDAEYTLLLGHFNFATQQNTRGEVWLPYNEDTNCGLVENKVRWALNNPRTVDLACEPYVHPFDFENSHWDNSLWECWYSWISKMAWAFEPISWRLGPYGYGISFLKETATNFVPFFITAPVDAAVVGSIGFQFGVCFSFYKPEIVETDLTEIILFVFIRADSLDDSVGPIWNFQIGLTLADYPDFAAPNIMARLDVTGDVETFTQGRKVHIALGSNCTGWAMSLFTAGFDIIPM